MVKGLGLFKEHFKDFTGSFVIIGGTACSLLLEGAGLPYRATKDIDIILYVETLNPRFGKTFWDFVKKAGYKHLKKAPVRKSFTVSSNRPAGITLKCSNFFPQSRKGLNLPREAH